MTRPFRQKRKPAGYTFGRPTLYRPEYCARSIAYMRKGYSVTALAGHLGVGRDALYEWITRHADFADAINKGRALRVAALERKLLTTGQGVGVTAAIFALKNAAPDEWQDRYNTTTDINVKIERIPDAELMRIASTARSAPLLIEQALPGSERAAPLGTALGTDTK